MREIQHSLGVERLVATPQSLIVALEIARDDPLSLQHVRSDGGVACELALEDLDVELDLRELCASGKRCEISLGPLTRNRAGHSRERAELVEFGLLAASQRALLLALTLVHMDFRLVSGTKEMLASIQLHIEGLV